MGGRWFGLFYPRPSCIYQSINSKCKSDPIHFNFEYQSLIWCFIKSFNLLVFKIDS